MQLRFEIPEGFWSLFRSVNRETYIEALMAINEEYQYSNYFLTREVCIQVLRDLYMKKQIELKREEDETEFDMLETPSARILNWLIRKGWLKKIEDYNTLVTNIVIPDYAAIFVDAFERLSTEDLEETEIYIQNVYATLFSFKNDPRVNLNMLRTALINTRRLNKALQDMLHNMDKFFARLLEQQFYGDLLKEHLDGYVEEIVRKKYHILKTSDNFYIYKTDIKECLRQMRDDEEWIEKIRERARATGDTGEDVLELLDMIERGFDDIEHRISNMDKEHSKYEEVIQKTGEKMNLSLVEILSEKSLYKRRKNRKDFVSQMAPEEEVDDLDREDVLRLNRIKRRFSKKQIEEFIEEHIEKDVLDTEKLSLTSEEDFEKLILAYDLSTRKNSKYKTLEEDAETIEKNGYRYPALKFVRRHL